MKHSFQITGLAYEPFEPLFLMDEVNLKQAKAIIMTAEGGEPCRVSLQDAEPGKKIVLCPYKHLQMASPYDSEGPVFVRQDAACAHLNKGEVPGLLARRLLSLRAYDKAGHILQAEVSPGDEATETINTLLSLSNCERVHIHFAKHGCFACQAVKA